jgi:hypothetical protein
MDILRNMVDRCDILYGQKTADISRGLERDFMEGKITLDIYQSNNEDMNELINKFVTNCRCNKRR